MFQTDFQLSSLYNDSVVIATIDKLRKRPKLKIWMSANATDTSAKQFKKIMDTTKSIKRCTLVTNPENESTSAEDFAAFLLWAYQR